MSQNNMTWTALKEHFQSEILPEWWKFYTSTACDACDKYHVCAWVCNGKNIRVGCTFEGNCYSCQWPIGWSRDNDPLFSSLSTIINPLKWNLDFSSTSDFLFSKQINGPLYVLIGQWDNQDLWFHSFKIQSRRFASPPND